MRDLIRQWHKLSAKQKDDFFLRNLSEVLAAAGSVVQGPGQPARRHRLGVASTAVGYFAGWRTEVSTASVMLAVGFSGAIGVFFGFYPARTASRLAPDALRRE